jgi:dTMP kinase
LSLFITFEGGEGCGKTTQARVLFRKLSRLGYPVLLSKEPGGTRLGQVLARRLKNAKSNFDPISELFLFAAARAHLVSQVIRPTLEKGEIVILDRFADSTAAYQGYGRGLDLSFVNAVNHAATGGLRPDLIVLLDIDAEVGLERKGSGKDRFEQEEIDFHHRIREGYLKLAAAEPGRWLVLDATLPPKEVEELIWERVKQLLPKA